MSTFKRSQPPLALQWGLGVFLNGIFRPLVRTLEAAGWAERALGSMSARRDKQVAKKNPLRSYVPGKQDVFVMTYAKSGTNWMMQIAHQLIHHGQGEFDHLHDLVPWPDTQVMGPLLRRYAIPLKDATHWTRSPERKRVIKTHFNWELLPFSEEARYIAVIRDPKDIFVSNYFFVKDSVYGNAMPAVETWFNLFLSDKFLVGGSWPVNTAGYWAQRGRPNVLVVSFKSMKRDLRATVLAVAEFLDIRVSDDVIDEVCRRSSFEYMKSIDHKFWMGKFVAWRPAGAMIRKGAQGGSSELLSPAQQRAADAYFMSELKRLGSDFPYEEFCDVAR
jgi:Sulfotransferase domain